MKHVQGRIFTNLSKYKYFKGPGWTVIPKKTKLMNAVLQTSGYLSYYFELKNHDGWHHHINTRDCSGLQFPEHAKAYRCVISVVI